MDNFANKTILITGATGFIGRHLIKFLKNNVKARLVVVLQGNNFDDANCTVIKSALQNLTKEIFLQNEITKIDLVFHLAAYTPKSRSEANDLQNIYQCNVLGTQQLLQSLPLAPNKIIFSSTLDVYSPLRKDITLDENSPVGNTTLYGSSKLFCEQMVKDYCLKNDCTGWILRYGNIFGPGEEIYKKLIPQTIKKLLKNQSPTVYGSGTELRDFLYIDDVIKATIASVNNDLNGVNTVNIVRGKSITVIKVIEKLIELTDFAGKIEYNPGDPGISIEFNNAKMKQMLGEWGFVSIQDGLKKEINYLKNA